MVWSEAWHLRGLLVPVCLLWILPVWMSSEHPKDPLCPPFHTLRDHLNSSLRKRYLRHNFPINYTIQVHYEEVFRMHNVSKLMNETAMKDLQYLWFKVTHTGIKRILHVLPERHPTRRRYLTHLEDLLMLFEQIYHMKYPNAEEEIPESLHDIWESLNNDGSQEWRVVTPKSLLDNAYRTMHCLFSVCFNHTGYCDISHWRRGNRTQNVATPQPT